MCRKSLSKIVNFALREVFVDKYNCIVCDEELEEKSKYGLCPECMQKMQFIKDDICKKCGRIQSNEAEYCLTCQNHKREFDFARSCVVYDDISKEIVRGIKFGHKKYFGKYISAFMIDRYEECFAQNHIDFIVPVPLTKKRKRQRRYNQASVIAKGLSEYYNIPIMDKLVAKIKTNQEQAKLTGKERENNVIGVYDIVDKDVVKGKNILIIDDVMTTGSTMSEIARILKKAKAKEVYCLSFASTRYKVQGENFVYEEGKQ